MNCCTHMLGHSITINVMVIHQIHRYIHVTKNIINGFSIYDHSKIRSSSFAGQLVAFHTFQVKPIDVWPDESVPLNVSFYYLCV